MPSESTTDRSGTLRDVKPVLTADEYRRLDKAYSGDLIAAMDRAGHAVALAAVRAGASYGRRVSVLAGPGNNGGDGYVAARYLAERGVDVTVHTLAPPSTPEAIDAARKADVGGIRFRDLATPIATDVVVDALFGGGVRGGLPLEILDWMGTGAPVVAVDYPTGLDPDTGNVAERAFRAHETVTFGSVKTGHVLNRGPDYCGIVTVADIGIEGGDPSMFIAEEDDAQRPVRRRRAHKWSAGAVLVVAGSSGLVGASVLAGKAAMSFGAGTVYFASSNVDLLQHIAPELPAYPLDQAIDQLGRFDVVLAGPGLRDDDAESVRPILAKADQVVLDAGGLTPATLRAAKEGGGQVVVTPHDGEFARLAGVGAGTFAIRSLALREGVVALRKGNPTMVSNGGLPVLVTTGGPELATIGTGDVLSGMIAALWARGLNPETAAMSAAYWHGIAAENLARSRTVTAETLVDHIAAHAW